MPKDIKFALLGLGQIGKKHAKLIASCPQAQLVAIVETSQVAINNEYTAPVFASLQELAESGIAVDVVNICSPNYLHTQHCMQGIELGYHVVCEKPMGLKKEDCEKVIQLSLQMGKSIFVVMQNRYSATAEWLRSVLQSHLLGDIYFVQVNCFWNRDNRYYTGTSWKGKKEEDGGVLFTQFSHFVDLLYSSFGDMQHFKSSFYNFSHQESTEFEDTGTVNFAFTNGGLGAINFTTSVWDKNMESSLTVVAQNGSLKIGGQYMENLEYCHIKEYQAPTLSVRTVEHKNGTYTGNDAHHFLSIQNVVETLQGKSIIATNAMEGLKVVELIEKMYKSRL